MFNACNVNIHYENLHQAVRTSIRPRGSSLNVRIKPYLSRNTSGNNDNFGSFKGFIKLVGGVAFDLVSRQKPRLIRV